MTGQWIGIQSHLIIFIRYSAYHHNDNLKEPNKYIYVLVLAVLGQWSSTEDKESEEVEKGSSLSQ
jgi:hypothetical protein